MKRLIAIVISLYVLIGCTTFVNARTFSKPVFANTDVHINNMVRIGIQSNNLPVLYATVLQNYTEKSTFNPLYDKYNYRSDDVIYLYEKDLNFSIEVNHITLLNNEFSFSLNKILADNEKVGVILDYGTTTKFVTGSDITFYFNQYSISDIYADDYVNVKIVIYIENIESNTIVRYGEIIDEYLTPSENPS